MKLQKIKIYKETTGLLIPISLKKNIPFKVKRIFIIHGKKNYLRGNHAHLQMFTIFNTIMWICNH